jgi:hypothetical protein
LVGQAKAHLKDNMGRLKKTHKSYHTAKTWLGHVCAHPPAPAPAPAPLFGPEITRERIISDAESNATQELAKYVVEALRQPNNVPRATCSSINDVTVWEGGEGGIRNGAQIDCDHDCDQFVLADPSGPMFGVAVRTSNCFPDANVRTIVAELRQRGMVAWATHGRDRVHKYMTWITVLVQRPASMSEGEYGLLCAAVNRLGDSIAKGGQLQVPTFFQP